MELTVDQALQKGIEAHKAGQAQEADKFYTAILQSQPKHPDANHNMGVLAVGIGNTQQALPFFKIAVKANPNIVQFWLSYIDALIEQGKISNARAVFNQAKDKGIKGEDFDQLEKRINDFGKNMSDTELEDNGTSGKRSNILDILTLNQATKLARKKLKSGFSEEAKGLYEDILSRFPKNKIANDGIKVISDGPSAAASKSKDPPPEKLQPLIKLYNQGQFQQSLDQIEDNLKRFPRSATLHSMCGSAHAELGNLNAAIESFKKAINIKPDRAEAYSNMGSVLTDKGELDAAIVSCKQAIKINPDSAEAYYNMGIALSGKGDLSATIESYRQALKIKPDFAKAYNNIGLALAGTIFTEPVPGLQEIITLLLNRKNKFRPSAISGAAISLLKFEPVIKELSEKYPAGGLKRSLYEIISELSELPLLLKLMSVCILADLEMETFLTDIRSSLLIFISKAPTSPELLRFQSALALQCFTNEYIYNQTDKEIEELEALKISVKKKLSSGKQPSSQSILCLGSYEALHSFEWVDLLVMTAEIEEVFTRQILEPRLENSLKAGIPVLEEISNNVSSIVRGQYEESPYPRWMTLNSASKPVAISERTNELKLKLVDDKFINVESPNILVAGCGTGQHSIEVATKFKNSKVLAIDLSLASLAYAKRKTEELGIQNIDYMQADILDLGKLDRQFDIIESVGVLHHMDEPMTGWKVLTDCLKPGGLMKIGLYSELARQDIVAAREEISQSRIGSSDIAMKSFRNVIINSNKKHYKRISESLDFHSLSMLRDALFHVREHRFSLPQIQDSLYHLGLTFCGFEYGKVFQNFKQTNRGHDDLYNLDKWHSYEEANPESFRGMYQFWCQKVA
jgi:tetratricopeptide (TPR) repeat protein